MSTRFLMVWFILFCITTARPAHAVPLSDLTSTPSFTDGTFTYSNWTAQFDVYVLDNSPRTYHIVSLPLDSIDVQAVNGSLLLTNIDVSIPGNLNVFLSYSYRVSVSEGLDLASVKFWLPGADRLNEDVYSAQGEWTIDDTSGYCITFQFRGGNCTNDQLILSGQSANVEGSVFFAVQNKLNNGRFQANFTAVPEPSTVVLVTTGLMAWAWRQRYK